MPTFPINCEIAGLGEELPDFRPHILVGLLAGVQPEAPALTLVIVSVHQPAQQRGLHGHVASGPAFEPLHR